MVKLFIKQQGSGQPVVFLHGWGFNHSIWDEMAITIHQQSYQVDLPGHGKSPFCDYHLSDLTDCLTEQLPENAIWIAWSLGGLLAMSIAIRQPKFMKALILVSSSPRFTATNQWLCAIKKGVLLKFKQQLQEDSVSTLQRFLALQVKETPTARQQLRYLNNLIKSNNYPQLVALQAGLDLLLTTDLREELAAISCPTLAILGEQDAIVPVSVGAAWQQWMPSLQVVSIKSAAHIPFLSHPDIFLHELQRFLHDCVTS